MKKIELKNIISEEIRVALISEEQDMTFKQFLIKLDATVEDAMRAVKGENGSDQEILPTRGDILQNFTLFRNYIGSLIKRHGDNPTKLRFLKENQTGIPSQEEVDKFFSDTQNEMHYLNQKPVDGQKGTRTHREIEPWDEYDLSNWNALNRKQSMVPEWPEEVQAYDMDVVFVKVEEFNNGNAKYDIVNKKTGNIIEPGGRVYGKLEHLEYEANDYVLPLGGTQSTQF